MLDARVKQLEQVALQSSFAIVYGLEQVQLTASTGYIEGNVTFVDGSRLALFEFLRASDTAVVCEKYRYHFMDAENALLFRYDNAPHHPDIETYPDHKHLPESIEASARPNLTAVFAEIERYILTVL